MSTALTTVPGTVAISDDEMRRFAPSVFASQPIASVSERYSFLPTSSILNGMRENGWVPVRAQEQSIRTEVRRGFQKQVVPFARVEHLQSWEKNQVRPEVVLVNSHDKSSAYQLHCGLFRLVCTNGMVVSDGAFQRISIVQHFESLDSSSDRNMGTRRICPSHDAAAGEGEDVKRRRWRHIVGAAKGDAFLGRFNAGAMDSVQHANHPGLLSQTPLTRA